MPDNLTDEQLLTRFAKGDDEALGELAGRYERQLLGLASGLLGGREDVARDAVQETWLRVIKSAKHFAGRSTVKTWLYRILINRSADLRSRPPHRNGDLSTVNDEHAHPAPDHAALSTERLAHLRSAVETLAPDTRLILLLSYHEGLTHDAAAQVLDIPVGTLKSRLHAGLEQLRAKLGKEATT